MFGRPGVSKRLERLEEDLRSLRSDLKSLELEWSDVYDKIRKSMGRIVKSRAIMEAAEAKTNGDGEASGEVLPAPEGNFTPRQRALQQQILRRRVGI